MIGQPVEIVEMRVRQLHRFADDPRVGRLAQHQSLLHPFVQQRHGDVAEKVFFEQRDQPANLGAGECRAVDHRRAVDRLFEEFADRGRVAQDDALLGLLDHRHAACVVHVEEVVVSLPRVEPLEAEGHALFAQQDAYLAAERAEGELVDGPHARPRWSIRVRKSRCLARLIRLPVSCVR